MRASVRRVVSAGLVSALGLLLLVPPLFDIWADWTTPPYKPLWTTVVENSLGLALALALVVGGYWVYSLDWDDEYVVNAARWSLGVVAGFALVFAWILGVQRFLQHDLKPYIIAMDAVVLGGVVALAIGVYDSRRRRNQDRLELERDRLSALYENAEDAIATVRFDADPVVEAANDAFRAQYGDDVETILRAAPGVNGDYDSLADPLTAGDALEFEWNGPDGGRDLLVNVTPVTTDPARGHMRVADITEQKQLARESEARERLEHLHRVASDLSSVESADGAFQRTLNALRTAVGFDSACVVVDGAVVATRGTASALDWASIDRVQPSATPADGGAVTRTTAEGHTVLTVPVGDDAVLQASVRDGAFEESQVTAAELLGTHLRETRQRLDREDRLRDQRERLELLARTFRHDLLNDVNVISARSTVLEDYVDESGAQYLETLAERASDMEERIETMRSLMKAVEGADRDLRSVELAPVVKSEVDDARDAYQGAAFELDTPLPDVEVVGDDLLPDVFENLLANAVEHNDSDAPRVRVRGERVDDDAVVFVADNGPGVPQERRDEVFELGEKGAASSGTGVGLNLCRRIVETYGGDITVEESDLDGAAFRVRLPVAE